MRSAWLVAASITTLVAICEAAVVLRMIPKATILDVAALIVTGFLAGLFTGLHVAQRRAEEVTS